ncbi:esterase [Mycobacterium kubicae]|uniref:Alpha/beta hydrolase fold domain-containing protein n=2 Tax=Mycobacterium kubicae TaxID=120959 RepID=A0AAX1JI74_9MYCO|nr:alpha/beta hydrolase [Mycobacterium kubicae]QNI07080.1 alpha/beta hydrolase [Mycobacterium kubicae]QNI12087.1 alpha/beta hydrolase [Mycobacterium kubicae]QPI40315.1 alpha/beta hydrolase fold domain-containing protein [Mycobacterium kubicae]GFG65055.1 esterase [Mycobacterium kubicae]
MAAMDSKTLKPNFSQRLLRSTGVRNRLFPPAKLERWAAHPRPPYTGQPSRRVLRKVDVRRADLEGRPVYEVTPLLDGGEKPSGHLLYLHGGAYVLDLLPHFHWPAIARIAHTVRRTMTVPIYPIAPEHSYREVFPFLLRVYRRMLQSQDPNAIAFMGDSAGGGMAFALCHAVRDAGLPQPTDALLLSPWMHLALPDPDVPAVAKIDPFLNVEDLRAAGIRYAGGDPLDNPLVSPSVGPLAGLPRLTIFTGTHDVLNPDARAFHKRATAEGLEVGWHELDGGLHTWMLLPGKKAAATLKQLREVLSA